VWHDPGMSHPRDEVEATVERYVDLRERIESGANTWLDLAAFFTDDVVYIDPAWGRVQGIDAVREFLVESMTGLEDWRFPIQLTAIDGDDVIVKWAQVLPSGHRQSGWTHLVYAGDGKFRFEEDSLNMVHVLEDLKASSWRPRPGFNMPPATPDRDFSVPGS
jgi:limonene-1,2-epoxide hydrolase